MIDTSGFLITYGSAGVNEKMIRVRVFVPSFHVLHVGCCSV